MKRNTSRQLAVPFATAVWIIVAGCQPTQSPAGDADDGVARAAATSGERSQDDAQAVAMIGDRTITMGELDEFIKDGLFANKSSNFDPARLYEMRSKALGRFIEQAVVDEAASLKGISAKEYLEETVPKEGDIPDEDVVAYYEANRDRLGDAVLEDVSPRIRSHLRVQLAADLVLEMTKASDSVVLLRPVRTRVAATGPSQGPNDAPITIIEFSDFQCPFCKRVVPTLHQIVEKYPEQVRIVFRHLPLDRIHDRARPAAEASACADQQDKFWAFHDILFENNQALSDQDFSRFAAEAELDVAAFDKCVADREFEATVQLDAEAAAALGLRGTPAFFINGIEMRGAKPFEEFVRIIDTELALQRLTAPKS